FNSSETPIDLSGFVLDDEDGGSRPYVIDDGTSIEPGQYLVLPRTQTKLALNNTGDQVRLLLPDETPVTDVVYEKAAEGKSYVFDPAGEWQWTDTPTPGKENVFTLPLRLPIKAVLGEKIVAPAVLGSVSIAQARMGAVGSFVEVSGTVAVLPGILGTQYFYIVEPNGGGIQVYMNKKDFPELAVGDTVTVSGEISEAYGEKRIKLKQRSDIVITGHGASLLPTGIAIAEINDAVLGGLVTVRGEITQARSSYMYLDDGTDEIKVTAKQYANIDLGPYDEGAQISVTGVVTKIKDGWQLLPRSSEDIALVAPVFSEGGTADQISKEGGNIETYLTATAVGLTSLLAGLLARAKGSEALKFVQRSGQAVVRLIKRKKDDILG
ncbi:MAG: lamin tail domain-containing protein, partial [Patescibacteria group bacterium]